MRLSSLIRGLLLLFVSLFLFVNVTLVSRLDHKPSSSPSTIVRILKESLPKHKVVKCTNQLQTSPHTIVTAYFRLKSKYPAKKYEGPWLRNFMSLQDNLVIFTQTDMVEKIKSLRSHALDRTVIISMDLSDLPLGQMGAKFWQRQLDMDPERLNHQSYQLFWVWLSKSWFVLQAINLNLFQSDFFMWSDIGCFRHTMYNHVKLIENPEFAGETILWMAHHKPNPPPYPIWNDKLGQPQYFFHSGSQAAGKKTAWRSFHEQYAHTLDVFVRSGLFIGEDQCVLQATCQRNPLLCAYVPFDQVSDNNYFGVRYVLHFKGDYKFWYMPATERLGSVVATKNK
jgi:hypothetical protein